jgi:ornithine cyclodeaminase
MKIVVLNEDDIKKVFTMKDAIQADKEALAIYSKGESNIPLRINIDVPKESGQSLYMPGYAAEAKALGVKIVSVYPKNIEKGLTSIPAIMVLVNDETGEVCSIMDGTFLTRIRTGALSGAATDILARKDAEIFAILGTGGQAEAQLEAVLTVRNIKEVRLFDISKERARNFANRMSDKFAGKYKARFIVTNSSDEAVINADIITSITTAKEPSFDGRLIKKGAHINGVGSYTPEMHEIDDYILLNSEKVYVDTRNGVLNESGDFIIPMNANKFSEKDITGELGEVIIGKVPSRESDDEITFFKSVGSGILDIVTARKIYEKALEKGVGQIIEF